MNWDDLLLCILDIAKIKGLNTPYLVGGVPRDIAFKKDVQFNDFDITTGSDDVSVLAKEFANFISAPIKELGDGHFQVTHSGYKFDFSSNFMYKNIDEMLGVTGLKEFGDLERETFSRDFTINTLLITLDLQNIIDITGRGLKDISGCVLECPLDCKISFKSSPNRILRAFYYKAKYGLDFSDGVQAAIEDSLDLLESITPRYASHMINAILRCDPNMIHELLALGIVHKVPLTKELTKILLDNKMILEVL